MSIRDVLAGYGYKSELTPATYSFDPETLTARWSHKHLAHIAGLGRFGINAQLITPSGCAGRLGSLVTEARLGDNPLVREKELCLHKAGSQCLQCVKSCPVGAVTLKGIERRRCNKRIQVNRKNSHADRIWQVILRFAQSVLPVCGAVFSRRYQMKLQTRCDNRRHYGRR